MKKNHQDSNNNKNFLVQFWNFRKEVLIFSISLAMIFFIISSLIPASYKAFSSIAINQKRTAGIDAYREAKSSEFMARTVKEMIMANSFMKNVLKDEQIVWPEMEKIKTQDEKIKYWKKQVKVSVVPNTGVLSILVYTRDRELSKNILLKIIEQLQGEKAVFLASKGVKIEVINEPYYFHKQATPNLALNTILGFIVGIVISIIIISFGEDNSTRRVLKNKKSHKEQKIKKLNKKQYTEFSSKEIELFSKSEYGNFNFK